MTKKSNKVLEAELMRATDAGKELTVELTRERQSTSHAKKDLAATQRKLERQIQGLKDGHGAAITEHDRCQKKLQELEKKNLDLQTALDRSKALLEKIKQIVDFFTREILKSDGTFPKFKWYNVGKLLQIVKFLTPFIPEIIAIFKKK
jgi:chromosome segregation ATPase